MLFSFGEARRGPGDAGALGLKGSGGGADLQRNERDAATRQGDATSVSLDNMRPPPVKPYLVASAGRRFALRRGNGAIVGRRAVKLEGNIAECTDAYDV
jgi:hypothetical protein